MPTFRYAKLVRDNIVKWHEENGHTVQGSTLSGEELRRALSQKLHEEADEVHDASNRNELVEEIGDVQQIVDDLRQLLDIADDELRLAMTQKTARKGGFLGGAYIETVTIPDEQDKWAQYCRSSPEKYPEVKEEIMNDPEPKSIEKGTYRHAKSGKLYEVLGVALQTETNEQFVIYRPLYENTYELFARPFEMFMENVVIDGREVLRLERVEQ